MAVGKSTFLSSTKVPDVATSVSGKGFSTTGLVRLPDGTWWVANDGLSDAADKSYSPSLVHLSADFKTKLGEISLVGSNLGKIRSVQGLTYDTKDGTLWFASRSEQKLYEITTGGAVKQTIFVSAGVNGISYDARTDAIWTATAKDDDVSLISTKTGATLKTFALVRSDPDHLFVDTANNLLYFSYGDSGRAGNVVAMSLSSGKEVGRYQLAQADAIEGIYVQGSKLYVANNGFYHQAPSATNAVLSFEIVPFSGGAATSIAIAGISQDTGRSSSDFVTNDGTLSILGSATNANGKTVTLSIDGKATKTVAVAGDKWAFADVSLASLADGKHTLLATIADAASTSISVTLDRTAPAAPVVGSVVDGADHRDAQNLSAGGTWTIAGSAEASALVRITFDGQDIGTATADQSGHWTLLADSDDYSAGAHSLRAIATDVAGNVSSPGSAFAVKIEVPPDGSDPGMGSVLSGGAGSTLVGGAGNDVLSVTGAPKLADGGAGDDLLVVTKSMAFAADSLRNIESVEIAEGTDVDFSRLSGGLVIGPHDVGASKTFTVTGTSGNDVITGGAGSDRLLGMQGNDLLVGGKGDDRLTGGPGIDTMQGGEGNDLLEVKRGTGPDNLDGGAGTDGLVIDFGKVVKPLTLSFADPSSVQVLADGTTLTNIEQGTVTGGTGGDRLTGGALADSLFGNSGNDILNGGGGNDTLGGGDGQDVFVFAKNWGGDIVTDFDATADHLDFQDAGIVASDVAIAASGADTLISLIGGSDFIKLLNIEPNKIGMDDILFA